VPVCNGAGKALQFDGGNWSCKAVSQVFSANNVHLGAQSECQGTYQGGLCSAALKKNIVFPTAFSAPPHVIVTPENVSNQGGCVGGATDKVLAYPENITTTGFTVVGAGSPAGGGCSGYDGWTSNISIGWIAIGTGAP
jgi:hypothetical protein